MKWLWWCLLLVCWSGSAHAADPVMTISWSRLQTNGELRAGQVLGHVDALGGEVLQVSNDSDKARAIEIVVLTDPGLTELTWNLRGRIRYENIIGRGYLELLNTLPSGTFFTKTLAKQGPMAELTGTSAPRDFVLPFDASQGGAPASRLTFKVMLPPGATVEIGPLHLHHGFDTGGADGAWWSDSDAGWFGGIAGTLLGLFGALIGWLVQRRRARRFVSIAIVTAMAMGATALVSGIVALAKGQPYAVYYPLLLIGLISLFVFGFGRKRIERQYEEHELRKMRALDVGP